MAAGAFEAISGVIGVTSDLVDIFSTIDSDFGAQDDAKSTVRIGLGLSDANDDGSNMSGNPPSVALWDDLGNELGSTPGSTKNTIHAGNFQDITVDQGHNTGEPVYVGISAGGDDAICISYISLTSPSSQKSAWTGDVGYKCGAAWHYSSLRFGGNGHQPYCTWIDKDGSNGIQAKGMGMHIPDFNPKQTGLAQEYRNNTDAMCKSTPRFSMYSNIDVRHYKIPTFQPTLRYNSSGADDDLSKVLVQGTLAGHGHSPTPIHSSPQKRDTDQLYSRNQTTKGNNRHKTIILTKHPEHQTTKLCTSEASHGPSMANLYEGLFCDMERKKLLPVCNDKNVTCSCLDLGHDHHSPNGTKPFIRGSCKKHPRYLPRDSSREVDGSAQSFKSVISWLPGH